MLCFLFLINIARKYGSHFNFVAPLERSKSVKYSDLHFLAPYKNRRSPKYWNVFDCVSKSKRKDLEKLQVATTTTRNQ